MAEDRLSNPEEKRAYVLEMFAQTARHYDRMNHILSLGQDPAWRRVLVERANVRAESRVLDVAAGTGDVIAALAARVTQGAIVGLDFSRPMIEIAAKKLAMSGGPHITLVQGDGLRLPFPEDTFDAATSAFALRNVVDVPALFAEMRRVLRPCGRLACLEIRKPSLPVYRTLFGVYFNRVVPLLGRVIARNGEAYAYLPDSLNRFHASEEVLRMLREAGLRDVGYQTLMLGTVAVYVGLK